jgi:lipopolysaccharide export system permease protein
MKIGAPLAVGGLLLSLLAIFLGEVVVPKMSLKMHYVQDVLIEGSDEEEITQGAKWVRNGHVLINFKSYDMVHRRLENIKIVEVRPNFRPKETLEAETADFIPESNKWRLENIRVTFFNRNGTLNHIENREHQIISIPIEPQKLKKERRNPNELSVGELREMVRRGDSSGADTTAFKVDFHMKFAYPFAAFVVSLIGLKFGYRSERATETAKGVLFAFMIGIGYWFILNGARALGQRGSIHPFIAAWMANVVVLGLTMWDSWRARVT